MKLGVIGTGMIATEVLSILEKTEWKCLALCSTERSAGKARELAEKYDIAYTCTDYQDLLKQDLDAVYIATPNVTHETYIRQALEAGRNVIVEKPAVAEYSQFQELVRLARKKKLFFFEAISTLYLPMFQKAKELLPRISQVKMVSANFSQYSSRYDRFLAGDIAPVFDPKQAGGAMMDLQVYNLNWIMGLLGEPVDINYQPNIDRGIDTSGMVTLSYGDFQAVSLAGKDCSAPARYIIQGTKGYIQQETTANILQDVMIHLNDGTEEHYQVEDKDYNMRLVPEFQEFARQIKSGFTGACYKTLDHSLMVSRLMTEARLKAGIFFD